MRLTSKNGWRSPMDSDTINAMYKKLAAYEDTGLTPEEFKESVDFVLELNKKLKPYMDAEEQGRLVILPCKVGDMVYALWSVPTQTKYVTYLAEVKEIRIAKRNTRTMLSVLIEPVEFRGRRKEYFADDFGKLVFLTREEAEAALKGGNKDASNS